MTITEQAISHYTYGITHDIFSEPVITYAKLSIEALEKQLPTKPLEVGKYGFGCPHCKEVLGLEKEDMYIYEITPPKYCEYCGQALDWGELQL